MKLNICIKIRNLKYSLHSFQEFCIRDIKVSKGRYIFVFLSFEMYPCSKFNKKIFKKSLKWYFFLLRSLMFYTVKSKTWSIRQAHLDGSNSSILVDNIEELFSSHGMTIDFANQQLYWVDHIKDTIERININGKNLNRNTITRVRNILIIWWG